MRVPFLNEKNISTAHKLNRYIVINSTPFKLKEDGYFWETLLDDVKEYVDNCSKCIISTKDKNINSKLKIIITNGPLELVVAGGWKLDNELKKNNRFQLDHRFNRTFFEIYDEYTYYK